MKVITVVQGEGGTGQHTVPDQQPLVKTPCSRAQPSCMNLAQGHYITGSSRSCLALPVLHGSRVRGFIPNWDINPCLECFCSWCCKALWMKMSSKVHINSKSPNMAFQLIHVVE